MNKTDGDSVPAGYLAVRIELLLAQLNNVLDLLKAEVLAMPLLVLETGALLFHGQLSKLFFM